MKYKEDAVIRIITDHIARTYEQHYVGQDGVQALDVWKALGSFDTSCRDTSLAYLFRYGKKNGKNPDDILKAIHFLILLYAHDFPGDTEMVDSLISDEIAQPIILLTEGYLKSLQEAREKYISTHFPDLKSDPTTRDNVGDIDYWMKEHPFARRPKPDDDDLEPL